MDNDLEKFKRSYKNPASRSFTYLGNTLHSGQIGSNLQQWESYYGKYAKYFAIKAAEKKEEQFRNSLTPDERVIYDAKKAAEAKKVREEKSRIIEEKRLSSLAKAIPAELVIAKEKDLILIPAKGVIELCLSNSVRIKQGRAFKAQVTSDTSDAGLANISIPTGTVANCVIGLEKKDGYTQIIITTTELTLPSGELIQLRVGDAVTDPYDVSSLRCNLKLKKPFVDKRWLHMRPNVKLRKKELLTITLESSTYLVPWHQLYVTTLNPNETW